MKLILDTNIFFSAYAFDKTILKLANYCLINHSVYISDGAMTEIKSKFLDGKMASVCKNFEHERALEYLQALEVKLILVNPETKLTICRDPKDNIFLELAKAVQADYLITGDNDLLTLNKFENTEILKPSQFIAKLDLNL
jgi:putative PIN family toxin of toxin-antitoxin system